MMGTRSERYHVFEDKSKSLDLFLIIVLELRATYWYI